MPDGKTFLGNRRGNAMMIALIFSVLIGIGVSVFTRLSSLEGVGAKRMIYQRIERDANASAIEIANRLVVAGDVQGYTAVNPPGTTFYAAIANVQPSGPGQGGTWSFSPGYLQTDANNHPGLNLPVAQLTITTCNPKTLTLVDLIGASPTPGPFSTAPLFPELPPAGRCTFTASAKIPVGFKHLVTFFDNVPTQPPAAPGFTLMLTVQLASPMPVTEAEKPAVVYASFPVPGLFPSGGPR